MHRNGCKLEFWPWLASSSPKQEEGGKGTIFFSGGSLQGWFAQVWAVELQAAANSSCCKFQLLFIWICILQIIITQKIMHDMQIAGPVLLDTHVPLSCIHCVMFKGVGPSTTLDWPGWKQPDIPVEVDTARLETRRREAGVLMKLSLDGLAKLSRLRYSWLRYSWLRFGLASPLGCPQNKQK